jgi:hypothetical protein
MRLSQLLAAVLAVVGLCSIATAAEPAKQATQNVILYMTDGLRWQEVFAGADEALLNKQSGVSDVEGFKARFGRDTPEERREALMPFFWTAMAKKGQVYGNQAKGSVGKVINGMHFSYPGYNETLCGFADPRIDSNDKRPNHNVTVFEWLHKKPGYQGRVAAFGVWDVFPFIFNDRRCGFLVNAGRDPLTVGEITPRIALLNELKALDTRYWVAEPFDSLTIATALEYMKLHKPRLLFLSLNETDAWGHAGRYDLYLEAARRADDCLRMLWETTESLPEYKGKTSIIFLPDHGRGDAPEEWKSHGEKIARSEFIWMGFLGPDTPPLGERANVPMVTQSQVAATLAALLGEDYAAAAPEAGKPIKDVLGAQTSQARR